MTEEERIRPLRRAELDVVLDWAAEEGWNPGLADADVFWAADPDGFLGVERDGELIGSGSIVSYGGEFGFMGLFIVRPGLRGRGIGRRLWLHRRDLLRDRLRPGAAIGLDGVFDMQAFYAAGGFEFSHRGLRLQGTGTDAPPDSELTPLADLPFEHVAACDRAHFGFARSDFLRRWIDSEGGLGLGLPGGEGLRAMGVIRPCRDGHKVGPLFAEGPDLAERVLTGLLGVAAGEPVSMDAPEANPAAIALAERHGMTEVFGCARMYMGPAPELPWERIYGITSFELG